MKFGVTLSTFAAGKRPATFGDGRISPHLQEIKKLGYHGIDLFIRPPSDQELQALREDLERVALEISVIFPIVLFEQGLILSDPDRTRRREAVRVYKTQIDLASVLMANIVLGLGRGNPLEGESESAFQERLAGSMKEIADYGDRAGVEIVFEPIHRFLINSFQRVDQCLEFFERYHLDSLRLLLDTFHMNIEEKSMEGAIALAGKRIGHVHMVDNNRGAPGDGHINFVSILMALKSAGYDGYLSVETEPQQDPVGCARRGITVLHNTVKTLSSGPPA